MTETSDLFRAFGLGVVSGLRSMTAPAVVTASQRDASAALIAIGALGELIADKLPFVPSRTQPPALAFRAVSGAYVGSRTVASAGGERGWGAVAGAAGALVGSFAGERARRELSKHIPAFVVALVEDASAILLASLLR
jgi:uncharacterized membrane protein